MSSAKKGIAVVGRKRALPKCLAGKLPPEQHARWLDRKAAAHVKRDKNRGFRGVSGAAYRDAIQQAVLDREGKDFYTGEDLRWDLVSKYDNEASKAGRHAYKAEFAMLPTVDHVEAASVDASFRICAWRTNDAKNALSHESFLELCERVLRHAGYTVTAPSSDSSRSLGR